MRLTNPMNRFHCMLVASVSLFAWCGLAVAAAKAVEESPDIAQVDSPAVDPAATGPATTPTPTPIPTTGLPAGAHISVIPVNGMIHGYTFESLKRRSEEAVAQGVSLIVIDLDTPGGLVTSALKISKYIKALPVRTVAWVNNEAFSAGIMIAAACDDIIMAPASTTGDCAPIVPGVNLSPTERAKALSPILEEFRDSAARSGKDYVLYHAMCVLGIEVYQIRHKQTGQIKLVNQVDYAVMVDGESPKGGWWSRVIKNGKPADSDSLAVATATLTDATEQDRSQWELISKVHDGTTLLTLNQTRAFEVGLSANDATADPIRTATDAQRFLGGASVTVYGPSKIAQVAYWLTQPWVRAILVFVLMVSAYVEMQVPGIGIAGLTAVAALLMLLVAPYLVGLAQVWHVILFIVGVVLLVAEIFLIPGFGVLGIAGVIAMFMGLVLMVVPTSGQGPVPLPAAGTIYQLQESVLSTLVGLIASGIGFYYITKAFGTIPILNRLVLAETALVSAGPAGQSFAGANPSEHVSGDEVIGRGRIRVGSVGRSVTELRPSGRAEFDGDLVDVLTWGSWIEPGRSVRVIEAGGNRIVVEAESSDDAASPAESEPSGETSAS